MDSPNAPSLSIADNSSQSVTLEGRSLILVNRRGELFLFENNCPHANESMDPLGGSLSDDSGDLIRCQRHGAEFLAHTGECVAGPCMGETLTPVAFTLAGGQIYLD
ncbi:Rieske 2Fe-2S domain-containing protein [Congregibacter brevis]|uniref:Rieske 2Fe-2S domain-containing protein n=1 Tax=Congregibacter brevis TaxID=3081201 RepID=A0ABZ0IF21_9GAMM|nr:Rieske 2Fe-2S domain-containing protein [Congregibacter sp. IMCC45268]